MRPFAMLSLCAGALLCSPSPLWAAECADLAKMQSPGVEITRAAVVTGGEVQPPYGGKQEKLPAFCRVEGVLRPTADSDIRFEVWLPETGWNGRFLGTGNGGFAGTISYDGLAGNLRRGFATAGSDAGHQAGAEDASWAYKHPEKVVDFGWRALHLETEEAKRIVQQRYGRPAEKSYFDSCSDGGREALMEAQRFPADFDGILAGAPANDWTDLLTAGLELGQVLAKDPAGFIPALKLPAITRAVLAACDAADGLKDGVLSDPRACHFRPETLLCKNGDGVDCLSGAQVRSLEAVYGGAKDKGGRLIFPGLMPGDEADGWKGWVVQTSPTPSAYAQGYFRYMVYGDPVWNPLTADVEAAGRLAKERTAAAVDAVNPDLSAFVARGGKLILYHGWNDPAISPLGTVQYYGKVQAALGTEKAASAVRLYMVPGMAHCVGGPGPSAIGQFGIPTAGPDPFAAFSALEQWVEQGKAPGDLLATQYGANNAVERTRPVCAYPAEARYDGTGDPKKAASFRCAMPGAR